MTTRSPGPSGAMIAAPVDRLLGHVTRDALPGAGTGGAAVGFAAKALPSNGHAVGEGRRFVDSTLGDWKLDSLVDSAEVIVSELLSNALRYGLTSGPHRSVDVKSPLWTGLLLRGSSVLVAVCDYSSAVPRLREADFFAQSGRGLHIVDCLSETWGWTTPDTAGKAVWATVACPDGHEGRRRSPRCERTDCSDAPRSSPSPGSPTTRRTYGF